MSKLLIIDGDFLLFTATHGNKICNRFGAPIKENNKFIYMPKTQAEVYECCDKILHEIADKTESSAYIGYLGHTKNFRYDIYPEYKANRKDRELPEFYWECKQYLVDAWDFNLCTLPLEADDYVNITKNRLRDDYEIIVVSNDKDLIHCTPGTFYIPNYGGTITTSQDRADYNFYFSMITGDSTDNIKGIPGRGPKYAEVILHDSDNYRQSIVDAYYLNLGENESLNQFQLNYDLLKILDDHEEFELPEISYIAAPQQIDLPDDWDVMKEIIDGREPNTSL